MVVRRLFTLAVCGVVLISMGAPVALAEEPSRAKLLEIARETMAGAGLCVLITLDAEGKPRARTMDPFEPDEGFVVWLGTNRESRKVQEIRNDSRVTLYYYDSEASGYVTIAGIATLIDDEDEKTERWKEGWTAFYPDRDATYLLIKVVPDRLELINIKHGIEGDPKTWTPSAVVFREEKQAASRK